MEPRSYYDRHGNHHYETTTIHFTPEELERWRLEEEAEENPSAKIIRVDFKNKRVVSCG